MLKPENAHVLIVDDDPDVVDDLADTLKRAGYDVFGTTQPDRALIHLDARRVDLVLADVVMPQMRGDELLRRIHGKHPEQLVILMTAFGSIEQSAAAIREGACDFIAKPFSPEVLRVTVERALRERQMRRELVRLQQLVDTSDVEIVHRSDAMKRVVALARRAAASNVTVLLTGESGVGKGVFAQSIHRWSARAEGPFVKLNCAALPAALAEAELFGVRRGAYTDAKEHRDGLFVQAANGTLFLDEIADLPLDVQPKLLHALESGSVRPVGATQEVPTAARLVFASNTPLEESVAAGRFRADLFHRLNVVRIEIPPLRTRMEDLPLLIDHMLPRISARLGRPIGGVAASALRWMLSYTWPGNVRELANTLERAIALAEYDVLLAEDVQPTRETVMQGDSLEAFAQREASLAEVEAAYIRHVLERVQHNKSRAARILGVDRRTLHRKASPRAAGPDTHDD